MLKLFMFRGFGTASYVWLGYSKKGLTKLVRFNEALNSIDYGNLVTVKLGQYKDDILNSYVTGEDGVPYLRLALEDRFDRFITNNFYIVDELKSNKEEFVYEVGENKVTFYCVHSNPLLPITKKNILTDGIEYGYVSQEMKDSISLGIKLSKLATVETMRSRYNCDWVFDEQGNMKKDYHCICTLEELEEVRLKLQTLEDNFEIGFDVETSGTKIYYMPDKKDEKDRLLGFSISWEDNQAVYIPLESKVFACLDKQVVLGKLYSELNRLRLVAHNGMFEWKVMYDSGYTLTISEDTMLLDFNIFPIVMKGFRKLKNLTRIWFGHETWEFDQLFGGKADPELIVYLQKEVLMIYGCADADYTRMLLNKLRVYLNDSQKLPYRIDCNIIELLAKAEYYGAIKDVDRISHDEENLMKQLESVEATMMDYILKVGYKNYKDNYTLRLIEHAENFLGLKDEEEILNYVNSKLELENMDSDIRSEFVESMDSLLTEKCFNSDLKLKKILFEVLEYPVLTYKRKTKKQKEKEKEKEKMARLEGKDYKKPEPKPAVDEDAMITLLKYKLEEPSCIFEDVKTDSGKIIIFKDELNEYKYPFAKLLLEYKNINKQLTTFYKQHAENPSMYWYNDNQMCNAVTARVISTAQLLDKRTKHLLRPYPNCYGINADYSQIEIRNMAGCANRYWHSMQRIINLEELSVYHRNGLDDYVKALNDPEKDVHRETAANMLRKDVAEVTSDERSGAKTNNFGLPYGMNAFAISAGDMIEYVDKMSEDPASQIQKIVEDAGITSSKWNFANFPIYKFLEYNRKNILVERKDSPEDRIPPYFDGHTVGYTENEMGRRRYFYLDDMTDDKRKVIFKEGGNFSIQSGSRDLFFVNKLNMYRNMKEMGLVSNPTDGSEPKPDKFMMEIFVHDEFFGSCELDVHPYDMVKLVYSNCFVKIPYHPTYFMGINFVNNWYEGKSGKNELPVKLVHEIVKLDKKDYPEFDNGYFYVKDGDKVNKLWVVDYFAQLVLDYNLRRIIKEFEVIAERLGVSIEDNMKLIVDNLKSYTVKSLILDISKKFCDIKGKSFDELSSVIYENRNHNFLFDEVEETRRYVPGENGYVSLSNSDELDEVGVFEDLFEEEDTEVVDNEVASVMNLNLMVKKAKEDALEKFNIQSTSDTNFNTKVKERSEYEYRNIKENKLNSRVLILISGKLIVDLSNIDIEVQRNIISEIKKRFEDPNGSLFEVLNNVGLRRQSFRVFNFSREDVEEVLKLYNIG